MASVVMGASACSGDGTLVSTSPDEVSLSGDLCEVGDLTCTPAQMECSGSPAEIRIIDYGVGNKVEYNGYIPLQAQVQTANGGCTFSYASGFGWSSENSNVAKVHYPDSESFANEIDGVALGSTNIVVTWGGLTAKYAITVTPGPPHHVSVTPASQAVRVGETVQYHAQVQDYYNNPIPGLAVTWSTEDANIATVSSSGVVTGRAEGTTKVRAKSSAVYVPGVASVTVLPPPTAATVSITQPSTTVYMETETVQLSATAYEASGAAIPGKVITWSTDDPTQATIDQTGKLTVLNDGDGQVTVTAAADSVSDTLELWLTECPYCSEGTPIEWGSASLP